MQKRDVFRDSVILAGQAEASLNALLDDEASKLRILDYMRKWLGDKFEEMPANRV